MYQKYPTVKTIHVYQQNIPSRKLTYPPQNDIFEDDLAFSPRWDKLVSWRVNIPIPRFPYRTLHGDVVKAEAGPSYAERKARREEEFSTNGGGSLLGLFL